MAAIDIPSIFLEGDDFSYGVSIRSNDLLLFILDNKMIGYSKGRKHIGAQNFCLDCVVFFVEFH